MIASKDICAVVVLYNPTKDVIENIKTYSGQIKKLFIVDNSDKAADDRIIKELCSLKNSEYISNNENLGIAAALNIGAKKGCKEKFQYILTMDQDSRASADMVKKMLKYINDNNYRKDKIGIIAPFANDRGITEIPDIDVEERTVVISSGNLLNLDAYRTAGDFRDDFFIDHVDHEYCLRLREKGYKILRTNRVLMDHSLGNISHHTLFGRPQTTTNHSPLRRYYMTRNGYYVADRYKTSFPEYRKELNNSFFYEFIKIILFEKNKLKKIKAIIFGYTDYRRGLLGKFENIHGKKL